MGNFIIICLKCNSDECYIKNGTIFCDYCDNKEVTN